MDVTEPSGERYVARPGALLIHDGNGDLQSMRWPYILHSLSHDLLLGFGRPGNHGVAQADINDDRQAADQQDVQFALRRFGNEGPAREVGTKFIAKLRLVEDGQTFNATPALTLTDHGLDQELADAGPMFYVSLLGMDAATKAATVQVFSKCLSIRWSCSISPSRASSGLALVSSSSAV